MLRKSLTTLLAFTLLLALASTAPAYERGDDHRDRPGDYVLNRRASLYTSPSAEARIIRELRPRTVVHVVEVKSQWYKIRSTSGKEDGWIRRSYADPLTGRRDSGGSDSGGGERTRFRVGKFRLTTPVAVHSEPDTGSKVIATLREGTTVRIVDKDRSGLWYRIESESGNRPPGYIPTSSAERVGDGGGSVRTREAPPLRRDDEYDRDERPSRDR